MAVIPGFTRDIYQQTQNSLKCLKTHHGTVVTAECPNLTHPFLIHPLTMIPPMPQIHLKIHPTPWIQTPHQDHF